MICTSTCVGMNGMLSFGSFYGCEGYKESCKFSVRTSICGKTISIPLLKELVEKGETPLIKGFRSNKGNSFDARLKLEKDGKVVFVFDSSPNRQTAQIKPTVCPICGKPILKGKTAFGCEGWKDGCTFRVPFVSQNERENVAELIRAVSEFKSKE